MEDILIGVTDRTVLIFIPDPASTDGSGKTGLTHADLTVSYVRAETDNDVVVTDVTSSLSTLTNLTDAHTDWGVKEVSSTLAPGLYRLDIADAVFASGAWQAVVYVMITTSAAAATPKGYRLISRNDLDGVRLGLTALPNAAADAAGGLPISIAGALDLDAKLAVATSDLATPTNITAGTITTVTNLTNLPSIPANWITAAGIAADAIGASELAADAVAEIADAIWEEALADHEGTVGSTAEALADAGGAGASAADIADAVWDEATAGHVAAGSFGKLSADVLADTNELQTNQGNWLTATGFSTHSAADVWASATRVLTAGTNIVLAKGTGVTGFNDITAAAVVAAMGTGTFLTAIPWNADWDVQVESEVADALAVYDPPTNAEMEARTIAAASYATAAALTTVDTVVDAIKVITDALGATAAARLSLSANQIIPGTVDTVTNTHTPTTTEFQADDITEATADHYNGRIVIFTSGALAGQATSISDYVAVGGIGQFTVVALTEAPANNDTFVVL